VNNTEANEIYEDEEEEEEEEEELKNDSKDKNSLHQ